jgi:hypothetical protein
MVAHLGIKTAFASVNPILSVLQIQAVCCAAFKGTPFNVAGSFPALYSIYPI